MQKNFRNSQAFARSAYREQQCLSAHTNKRLRPLIHVDWLAESEGHFIGNIIVIIWPINEVNIVMALLPSTHSDEISRSCWHRLLIRPTDRETKSQSSSIHVHVTYLPYQRMPHSALHFVLCISDLKSRKWSRDRPHVPLHLLNSTGRRNYNHLQC